MSTPTRQDIESPYAWTRLIVSVLIMAIGGSGMYSITVVLPRIQEDFGITRSDASMPYTLIMVGFGLGGILMGKISDRFGVAIPLVVGAIGLGLGFIVAGMAHTMWVFNLTQGLMIGLLGTSATFAPLVADTSQWFSRRRGFAVAICMNGIYLAGVVWPPIMQYFVDTVGWRHMYMGVGVFCIVSMLPLSLVLRRRAPNAEAAIRSPSHVAAWLRRELASSNPNHPLGFTPNALQALLCIAGVACCVAMAMPQVHIVAYCGDLGFGPARGAEMLALMMGLGIISRLVSGWVSDHIGGLRTLLLGSLLQGIALLLFLNYKGLVSLFVISGMFGLFQGGIVPAYAVIVREYFSAKEAGTRIGTVLMATLLGMALGGWLSGAIYDLTYSYHAAFVNSMAWNLLNISIVALLLYRSRRGQRSMTVAA